MPIDFEFKLAHDNRPFEQQGVEDYRTRLKDFGFDHLSIEVNRCENC